MPKTTSDQKVVAFLAKKRIDKQRCKYDKRGKLTSLDLSDLQLAELPREIGQLTNLQTLSLEDNQLTQLPREIGQLTNLQTLSLEGNQLTQLPREIGQLTNLRRLSLGFFQSTQNTPGRARKLRDSEVPKNQLTQLPPQISQLINLQELYIAGSKAQLPPEIGNLVSLRVLSIHNSRLTQLTPEIGQFNNLQFLYAGMNSLVQLPPEICKLSRLQGLYLFINQLMQLSPEIGQLTNLQTLALEGNQLRQLPPEISQLTNLQTLSFTDNPNLLTPPPEIVVQGTQEVMAFLQAIQRESVKRYEAKLLLVGEGGTRKSSLLRALHGKVFDASQDSTHGIEVETLLLPHPSLPGCPLLLNTWDFGGQDIYHATHQFFLTKRSLYLVVWNARTGDEQSKLDFWLKTLSVRAPEAPVLLVATHIDERPAD